MYQRHNKGNNKCQYNAFERSSNYRNNLPTWLLLRNMKTNIGKKETGNSLTKKLGGGGTGKLIYKYQKRHRRGEGAKILSDETKKTKILFKKFIPKRKPSHYYFIVSTYTYNKNVNRKLQV